MKMLGLLGLLAALPIISACVLVSLGIVRDKEQRGDLYLILSILVLFAAGSIILLLRQHIMFV